MVNIKGLNKAEVLAALYNNAKPQVMGLLHFTPEDMNIDHAEELLKGYKYFDYVQGRVMKVDLESDDEFSEHLYDRDNGEGSAKRVIDKLREKLEV